MKNKNKDNVSIMKIKFSFFIPYSQDIKLNRDETYLIFMNKNDIFLRGWWTPPIDASCMHLVPNNCIVRNSSFSGSICHTYILMHHYHYEIE